MYREPEQNTTDKALHSAEGVLKHSAMPVTRKKKLMKVLSSMVERVRPKKNKHSLKESLEEIFRNNAFGEGAIDPQEKLLLKNVLTFTKLKVEDVMITRADILYVDATIGLDELKHLMTKRPHTRMPVCRGSLDDTLGFIHVKDLFPMLAHNQEYSVTDLLREILFVPPSMMIRDLLIKMRSSRVHIALVVDEYGGTMGLVTMEDLMEEIVGEIEDEHDELEAVQFRKIGKGHYEASGRLDIEQLQDEIGVMLADEDEMEDFDTLSGLIFTMLGRIPTIGEVVSHPAGVEFEIKDADLRRIKLVSIRKTQDSHPA